MWFARLFGSSRRRERRKHAPRPRTRRLGLKPLELRRLLTVTISGNIEVSSLACAKGALVPVADAMVVASYTVGGQTQNGNPVWTDTKGHYQATIKCTAIPNSVVTITVSRVGGEEGKHPTVLPLYR